MIEAIYIQHARLVGFARILGYAPSFCLPLFLGASQESCPTAIPQIVVQEIDDDDKIRAFVPLDLHDIQLQVVEAGLVRSPGAKCLLVYEIDNGHVLIGEREEVQTALCSQLNNVAFLDSPFSQLQAAMFCGSLKVAREAIHHIERKLDNVPSTREYIRRNVLLLDDVERKLAHELPDSIAQGLVFQLVGGETGIQAKVHGPNCEAAKRIINAEIAKFEQERTLSRYQKGQVVECTVVDVSEDSIQVRLAGGAPGVIGRKDMSRMLYKLYRERINESIPSRFRAKITDIDYDRRAVVLSINESPHPPHRARHYQSVEGDMYDWSEDQRKEIKPARKKRRKIVELKRQKFPPLDR